MTTQIESCFLRTLILYTAYFLEIRKKKTTIVWIETVFKLLVPIFKI